MHISSKPMPYGGRMNLIPFVKKNVHFFLRKPQCIGLFLLFFVSFKTVQAQSNFGVSANYVYAFGERAVEMQSSTYHLNSTHGYEITGNGTYRFGTSNFEAVLELGFRQLIFSGNANDLSYRGQLNKLISAFGCRYIFSNRFNSAVYLEA